VLIGLKAYSLPPLARQIREALKPGVPLIAALDGIPWW